MSMFTEKQVRDSMRLYAVTDRSWLRGRSLAGCVSQAIEGGVTCVQLREKESDTYEFEKLAIDIKRLCSDVGIPFIINDDVEAAVRLEADGVHVGQDDMDPMIVRNIVGPSMIIGVSVQTLEQAIEAENAGADYLGVGAMFGTPTKPEATEVSMETLYAICNQVSIPVVAIGGLNKQTIPELSGSGVDGAAVVSAIFDAQDIVQATSEVLKEVDEMLVAR